MSSHTMDPDTNEESVFNSGIELTEDSSNGGKQDDSFQKSSRRGEKQASANDADDFVDDMRTPIALTTREDEGNGNL
ncbi:unnamed protein product [Gongylonema pulchrum]|uniref:CTNNB1_binding domain-containing protein n=1 Tax=Gongylonema pulchrum TaxID=637853 RepID=A0A183EUI3_9BILA|nr:unnamed protein product [Gongylonema pulchrum]